MRREERERRGEEEERDEEKRRQERSGRGGEGTCPSKEYREKSMNQI